MTDSLTLIDTKPARKKRQAKSFVNTSKAPTATALACSPETYWLVTALARSKDVPRNKMIDEIVAKYAKSNLK